MPGSTLRSENRSSSTRMYCVERRVTRVSRRREGRVGEAGLGMAEAPLRKAEVGGGLAMGRVRLLLLLLLLLRAPPKDPSVLSKGLGVDGEAVALVAGAVGDTSCCCCCCSLALLALGELMVKGGGAKPALLAADTAVVTA